MFSFYLPVTTGYLVDTSDLALLVIYFEYNKCNICNSTNKHTMSISISFLEHLIIALKIKVQNAIESTERLLLM